MNREQIKHTASEIVRSMTNYKLTEEQKKVLEDRARIIITNQLSKTSVQNEVVRYSCKKCDTKHDSMMGASLCCKEHP